MEMMKTKTPDIMSLTKSKKNMNPTERAQITAAQTAPFAVVACTMTRDSMGCGLTDWDHWASTHETEPEARAAFAEAKAKLEPASSEMQGSRRVWTTQDVNLYARFGQDQEQQLDGAESPGTP
jgi:hypothetical protein